MSEPIIPFKYAYLAGSLYFLGIWLFLFWRLPSQKKTRIIFGLIFMWIGIVFEYFWWSKDWWHPITITGTAIGVEDFIVCFTHVTLPTLLHRYFFSKDSEKFLPEKETVRSGVFNLAKVFGVAFIPFAVAVYGFGTNSFFATNLALFLTGAFILLKRRDLYYKIIYSAIIMLIIAVGMFFLGSIFSPGAVEALWNFTQLSGYKLSGIPVEDLLFYALVGFSLGGIYEYLFNLRLKPSTENSFKKDLVKIFEKTKSLVKA